MNDSIIDEDLESLLYAQVYYGKPDAITTEDHVDEHQNPVNNSISADKAETTRNSNKHIQRYYENPDVQKDLQNTSLNEVSSSTQNNFENINSQNRITIRNNTNTTESFLEITTSNKDQDNVNAARHSQPHLLNNITINQYIYPSEFQKKLDYYVKNNIQWSKNCKRDLSNLKKGKLTEEAFFKNLSRRLKTQQQRDKKQKLQKSIEPEVICLSSEDSDVEVVDIEMSETKFEKKSSSNNISLNEVEIEETDKSDDEIIYIAPPPVPIINVDESDSDEPHPTVGTKPSTESPEKQSHDVDDTSNDFLANDLNCSTENFNFSLHGSEFQNSDFARPANPTDAYETESSTSTSEFNKDSSRNFSNTVKTIVFNEVDFPKDDIFTENNIENFSAMITPKRASTVLEASTESEAPSISTKKRINARTSSESSSESDYETSNVQSNLPDLTPIIPDVSPTKMHKRVIDDKKTPSKSPKKKNPKRSIDQVESASYLKKKVKKKKKTLKNPSDNTVHLGNEMEQNNKGLCVAVATSTPKRPAESDILKKKKKKTSSKKKKKKEQCDSGLSTDERNSDRSGMGESCNEVPEGENQEPVTEPVDPNQEGKVNEETINKKKNKKKKQKISETNPTLAGIASTIDTQIDGTQEIESQTEPVQESIKENIQNEETDNDVSSLLCNNEDLESTGKKKNKKKKQKSECSTPAKNALESNLDDESCNPENGTFEDTLNREVSKPVTEEISLFEDLVIVDEVNSESIEPEVVVIDSSDSEQDFQSFDDVGDNLQLANTSRIVEKSAESEEFEQFDVEHLQSKMSDDPSKWEILSCDELRLRKYETGPRCHRCRQKGHMAMRCPNKPALPNCFLCGHLGHFEPRCPNKICLSCGNPGNYSTTFCWKCANRRRYNCNICGIPGHIGDYCPDLWRRYHLTTKEGPLVLPRNKSLLKPRKDWWCSGCASRGHLEHECISYRWHREYAAASPQIFQYEDVYRRKRSTNSRTLIMNRPQNLTRPETLTRNMETIEDLTRLPITNSMLQQDYSVVEPTQQETVTEGIVENQSYSGDMRRNDNENRTNNPSAVMKETITESENIGIEQQHLLLPQNLKKNTKINPVSLAKVSRPLVSKYQPYKSVLNPYSLFNAIPPNNNLFKPVPNALIMNQLSILGEANYISFETPIDKNPVEPMPNLPDYIPLEGHHASNKVCNLDPGITKKIMNGSPEVVKQLIERELNKLNQLELEAKGFKKKFHVIENLKKIAVKSRSLKRQIYNLYRKINMFLFGIRYIEDGKKHLDYLKNFLYNSGDGLKLPKRKALLESYNYIFGGEHYHFNYRRYLNSFSVREH